MFFKVTKWWMQDLVAMEVFNQQGTTWQGGEDTLMNTHIGVPDTSNSIIQSPRKLENGITIKAQHVINQCKGGSGLLRVGVQCGGN
jgi:hypothetical protein